MAAKHALHHDRDLVGLLMQSVLLHLVLQGRRQAEGDQRQDEQAQQREAQEQASTPEPYEPGHHALHRLTP